MKKLIIAIAVLLITPLNAPARAAEAVWEVTAVYDGDTVVMAKMDTPAVKIRLADIDAPEHDQPYGQEAKKELEGMLKGCDVHFMPQDIDRYGRTVATLYACGRDVNREMVRTGAAWVYTRYNTDSALPPLEASARASRRGLWAESDPMPPWDWRHSHAHH